MAITLIHRDLGPEEFRGLVATRIALATDYVLVAIGSREYALEIEARATGGVGAGGIAIRAFEISFGDRPGSAWATVICIPKVNGRYRFDAIRAVTPLVEREEDKNANEDMVLMIEDGDDYEHLHNVGQLWWQWICGSDLPDVVITEHD